MSYLVNVWIYRMTGEGFANLGNEYNGDLKLW